MKPSRSNGANSFEINPKCILSDNITEQKLKWHQQNQTSSNVTCYQDHVLWRTRAIEDTCYLPWCSFCRRTPWWLCGRLSACWGPSQVSYTVDSSPRTSSQPAQNWIQSFVEVFPNNKISFGSGYRKMCFYQSNSKPPWNNPCLSDEVAE